MLDLPRMRSLAAALVLVLVSPLAIVPTTGAASLKTGAAGAWARATEKRPESTGTLAQRLQAKAIVRASTHAAGHAYAYDRAVVQVRGSKAMVQAVAQDARQAMSTVFVVDLSERSVLAARTIRFAERPGSTIAVSVADGAKTRFRGAIDERTGKLTAAAGSGKVLSKAKHASACARDSAKASEDGQTVQAAGICEWAVTALCGTGGGAACYGACVALGLVSGPGGLGCAAVCGLIAALGCAGATEAICS